MIEGGDGAIVSECPSAKRERMRVVRRDLPNGGGADMCDRSFGPDAGCHILELVIGECGHSALDDLPIISNPMRNAPSVRIANPPTVPIALVLEGILSSDETALKSRWLGCKKPVEATHR
jgi:hypothetical protein